MTKWIFVHNPKAAGTSMLDWLRPTDMTVCDTEGGSSTYDALCDHSGVVPQHGIAYEASRVLPKETFDTRYKFGFVRNPFDREVSIYASQCIAECKWDVSFADWVKWRYDEAVVLDVESSDYDYQWNRGFCIRPQIGNFIDPDGNSLMNFIGRYESIKQDWKIVADAIGLPSFSKLAYWNSSMREYDYRSYYTDDVVDIVTEAHHLDLVTFNYEFERGMVSRDINIPEDLKLDLPDTYNFYYQSGGRGAVVPFSA
ncbi:sulfotransferase family protein [Pseudomonadales bacterium]|nr:sulfotransferase family protein [bacterium]MDB4435656.1 sulfotransferase family protein [bacterium]MDB4567559.1 sulfotransferase family protein [Pseudomonadales bacterium]